MTDAEKPAPPGWHKDAKWIVGILLLFVLSATLLSAALARLTERERAIEIASTVMAAAFSPQGLDGDEGLEEFRQQLRGAGEIQPFPGRDLTITAEEVEGLSAREIRIHIFRKIAEPLYDNMDAAIAALPAQEREQAANDLFIFSLLSPQTHNVIQRIFWALLVVSAVLMLTLVYFSRRWGRLVSPAMVLILASMGGAFLLTLLKIAQSNPPPPVTEEASFPVLAGGALQALAPQLAEALFMPYFLPFAVGLSLLSIAGIGKIAMRLKH